MVLLHCVPFLVHIFWKIICSFLMGKKPKEIKFEKIWKSHKEKALIFRNFSNCHFTLVFHSACLLKLMLPLRSLSNVTAEKATLFYARALNLKHFSKILFLLEKSPFTDEPRDDIFSDSHPRQWKTHFLSWICFWRPCKIN